MTEGRNAGVTGIIDLDGQSAKFEVWARAFTSDLSANLLGDGGRGDGEWPPDVYLTSGGFVTVGGSVKLAGWPMPDKFRGESGTLTLQIHTGRTVAYPVRVHKATWTKPSKEGGLWECTLICKVGGTPVLTGFGVDEAGTSHAQPTSATEAPADKVLWEGLATAVDPNGLALPGPTGRRLRVWGTSDNDAAEKAKVDAVLAAVAAPYAGMKVRGGVWTRAGKYVAYVDVSWGFTDTAEDVVNPRTVETVDPQGLESRATAAAINATPATPSGAAFKVRGTATQEINDDHDLVVREYGLTDTAEDVVNPITRTTTDPDGLGSSAVLAAINATAATPAGLVDRGVTVRELNDAKELRVKEAGRRGTIDDVEMPGTEVRTDADNLEHAGQETAVYVTLAGAPASPTVTLPTDAKVVLTATQEIDRLASKKTFSIGMRTPKEDLEWLRSKRTVDADAHLKDGALVVEVTSSATPDATGNNPDATNLSLYASESHRLTDTQYVHAHEFRPLTSEEELEADGTWTQADPVTALDGDGMQTLLTTNATETAPAVSGRVCVRRRSQRVSKTEYRHTFWYAFRSVGDQLEADKTRTATDPSDLETEHATADLFTVGAPPVDPAAPSGLKLVRKTDLPTANPTYALRAYEWGKQTSADRVVNRETWTETDPSGLRSRAQAAAINATPSLPGGYVERASRVQALNDDNDLTVKEGGLRSTEDDVEMDGTWAEGHGDDASRNQVTTVTTDAGSAVSIRDALLAGLWNDPTFDAIKVVKLTGTKAAVAVRYRENVRVVTFEILGGTRDAVAYTDGTATYVHVAQVVQVTSTRWAYVLAPAPRRGARIKFGITSRDTSATLPVEWGLIGSTNDAAFLGLPMGMMAYTGIGGRAIIDGAGDNSGSAVITQGFEGDTLGIVGDGVPSPGWPVFTATDLSAVVPGWVLASTLGLTIVPPTPEDYAAAFL